ncbi:hypothetical protein ABT173_28620 [Streptomyces sp. NPDC001795]|uniref:hypothetical protein n=1 Tax=unclassified Streptomyces TaxID=2593676 RepID=UPI00332D0247
MPTNGRPELSFTEAARFASRVESALYASKVFVYDQGWKMVHHAVGEYGWNIDHGAVARI